MDSGPDAPRRPGMTGTGDIHRKCTGYFSDFRKIAIIFRIICLTTSHPQIIILPTRTDEGRVAIVFAARNGGGRWPPRCRTLLPPSGSLIPRVDKGQTPATRADGSSACPGDSSHERGSVSASDAPGTRSRPQSPLRAERRRNLRPRPGSTQRVSNVGLDHRPGAEANTARGMPASNTAGAAGAAFRPVVPHAPSGDEE